MDNLQAPQDSYKDLSPEQLVLRGAGPTSREAMLEVQNLRLLRGIKAFGFELRREAMRDRSILALVTKFEAMLPEAR